MTKSVLPGCQCGKERSAQWSVKVWAPPPLVPGHYFAGTPWSGYRRLGGYQDNIIYDCATVQCVLSSIFTLYYLPSSPQSRGGSPLSPFLYSEHLGSPPPAHMGSLPYNLDPNKGPVGSYHHSYTGSLQCIVELQLNGWLWNTFKRWPVNAV